MDLTKGAVEEIERLGRQSSEATLISVIDPRDSDGRSIAKGIPFMWDRTEQEAVPLKDELDKWRKGPDAAKGTATALTRQSFVDLVNRHKVAESVIFQTGFTEPKLQAVIDYHAPNGAAPAWGQHRISYPFPLSDEFKLWRNFQSAARSVREFSEFLEDQIADLASPLDAEVALHERQFGTAFANPAEMMRLARGLKVRVEATVHEERVLQSGEGEIVFVEEHKDASGKKLVVPGLFVVNIPVFQGGERQRFICRLRYRVREGKLTWQIAFYDLANQFRLIVEEELAIVRDETALPVFVGSPEA